MREARVLCGFGGELVGVGVLDDPCRIFSPSVTCGDTSLVRGRQEAVAVGLCNKDRRGCRSLRHTERFVRIFLSLRLAYGEPPPSSEGGKKRLPWGCGIRTVGDAGPYGLP